MLYWSSVVWTQVYIWIFILLACRIVPRSWQESGQRYEKRGIVAMLRDFLEGSSTFRTLRRKRMLDSNPYFWRSARRRSKNVLVWSLLVGAAIFWCSFGMRYRDSWFDFGTDILILIVVNAALKWWITSESSRHLADDRRSGALELLLSTPLREHDVLRGQRRALIHQFGGPVAAVLTADFLFLLSAVRHGTPEERPWWLVFYLVLGGFLVFDMMALSTVGMWLGLSGRTGNRATIVGLLRIIILPTAAFVVVTTILAVAAPQATLTGFVIVGFWVVLCTMTNLLFMASANHHLRGFREIVAQRYATKFNKNATSPTPTAAADNTEKLEAISGDRAA
jgi:hypothetical protein